MGSPTLRGRGEVSWLTDARPNSLTQAQKQGYEPSCCGRELGCSLT